MDKGNKDQHRHRMSGLKVEETMKWGASKSRERYGRLDYDTTPPPAPKDMTVNQDPIDKVGDKSFNDVSTNSWLRGVERVILATIGRNDEGSLQGKAPKDATSSAAGEQRA